MFILSFFVTMLGSAPDMVAQAAIAIAVIIGGCSCSYHWWLQL